MYPILVFMISDLIWFTIKSYALDVHVPSSHSFIFFAAQNPDSVGLCNAGEDGRAWNPHGQRRSTQKLSSKALFLICSRLHLNSLFWW